MIAHIMFFEKFIPPFIDFVNDNFNREEHIFLIVGEVDDRYGSLNHDNVYLVDNKIKYVKLVKEIYKSKKFILHGFGIKEVHRFLALNPWLLKKGYGVLWGEDYYTPKKQYWSKKKVIKNIAHLVIGTKGEYDKVKKWYGAKGKFIKAFVYVSNLYKEQNIAYKETKKINIQVGNSASPTNNHIEVFELLSKFDTTKMNVITPLSYGCEENSQEVINKGKKLLGQSFVPYTEYLTLEKYNTLLASIDIAIFNHNRQQGMGNIITLLGLGKKVYMNPKVKTWDMFSENGITLFDINNINLSPINEDVKRTNMKNVTNTFSTDIFIKQLSNVFTCE